jgi:hypothetical protein
MFSGMKSPDLLCIFHRTCLSQPSAIFHLKKARETFQYSAALSAVSVPRTVPEERDMNQTTECVMEISSKSCLMKTV